MVALFGGIKIDLRDATFDPGSNGLSALAAFGGIELLVPDDLGVYVEGGSFFGGRSVFGQQEGGIFSIGDFETPNYRTAPRRLSLTAISMFGGIDVKRVPAIGQSPPSA